MHRYRTQHFAETLAEAGYATDTAYVGDSRVRVAHDVVVLHRICDVWEGRQFAQAARRVGAALVYSTDDLVWDTAQLGHAGMEKMREFAPRHAAMMNRADATFYATDFLSELAAPFVSEKPRVVARNFLGREQLQICEAARKDSLEKRAERARWGEFVLGYFTGTATHDADLAAIAVPLVAILRSYPHARLLLVGPVTLPAALEPVSHQVESRALLPWRDVPQSLADTDVNIAPLTLERPFNHGKSVIKFLEAGAVEVPTIASASAEYRAVIKNGECVLCESSEDWANSLRRLIEDAPFRHEVAARAQGYVLAHATPRRAQRTALVPVRGILRDEICRRAAPCTARQLAVRAEICGEAGARRPFETLMSACGGRLSRSGQKIRIGVTGLEPATYRPPDDHSNQLSYTPMLWNDAKRRSGRHKQSIRWESIRQAVPKREYETNSSIRRLYNREVTRRYRRHHAARSRTQISADGK